MRSSAPVRGGGPRWYPPGAPPVGEPVWLSGVPLDHHLGHELDCVRNPRSEDVDDDVAESVFSILESNALSVDRHLVAKPQLVAEPLGRNYDQAVAQVA